MPVSDSPREVAPDRASKPKRSRVALKPWWMPARKAALSRQREYDKTPARRVAQRTRAAKRYAADFGVRAATYRRVKKSRAEKASREAKLVIPKSARAGRAYASAGGGHVVADSGAVDQALPARRPGSLATFLRRAGPRALTEAYVPDD